MKTMTNKRYELVDAIRGFAIVNMVLYHFMWDLVFVLGLNISWFRGTNAYIWQQLICHTFILISGFSFSLSKKPLKNGVIVFSFGALFTAITVIFLPQMRIWFGILTFIGSAIIIVTLLNKLLIKIPSLLGFAVNLVLFLAIRRINSGFLGFENLFIINVPQELYANLFTAYLGFPQPGFYSTDYFSLFPWLFLFISGYYLHKMLLKSKNAKKVLSFKIKPFSYIGKKSLLIYVLHQPVLYSITIGLSYII